MNSHETAIAELLQGAAGRIPVDVDASQVMHVPRTAPLRRAPSRRRAVIAGVVVAVSAAAVAIAVWRGPSTATVETDPAGIADPADDTPAGTVAPHVVSPPDWFGEPRGAFREGGLRSGRWVTTAIGQVSADAIGSPIVISVFDGAYAPLDDAATVTIDGRSRRSVRHGGWQALATDGTPTVVASGSVDERTLGAVLDAVEVTDPSGAFALRLGDLPDGYDEVVSPRVLGPDPSPRRTLAGASGDVGINEVSDWTDARLAAVGSGADVTAVDLDGETGWTGVAAGNPYGALRFLVWSPRPGVVFEITTDDAERTEDDLVDLALATSMLAADEWDRLYD